METSDNIDVNHEWYNGRMIANAGSSVAIEAGSTVVLDYSIDLSHGKPHLNVKLRVAPEGEKEKGQEVEKLLGDQHYVDLELEGDINPQDQNNPPESDKE